MQNYHNTYHYTYNYCNMFDTLDYYFNIYLFTKN